MYQAALSLVRHHDHLAPALHVGTSSGAIANNLVETWSPKSKDPGALDMCTAQQLRDVAYLPAHLKHTYPIKKVKPDINVTISAA
jgi:hypothetical protein